MAKFDPSSGVPLVEGDGAGGFRPATAIHLSDGSATGADVMRGNVQTAALLTLAAQGAGTVNSADQTNVNGRGMALTIDITVQGGTPTTTVTIQGKDPVSGKYYTILVSTALAAVATTVLRVYPGITAAANLAASDILPRTWRVSVTIGGGTPAVTATIAACVIV
jgi:hypothetical protein